MNAINLSNNNIIIEIKIITERRGTNFILPTNKFEITGLYTAGVL